MSERALPDRRKTSRQRVMIGGCKLYIDCGFYEDGTVGELFIATEK